MFRPRVIPCLLLKGKGLVKTIKFRDPTYIGDPINAVKILNDKEVDELIFLDITATKNGTRPQFNLIHDIATECFMPFGYGGGIKNIDDAKKILKQGAEKIIINSISSDTKFIRDLSEIIGSQSLVVSLDIKKNRKGQYQVYTHSGTKNTKISPLDYAMKMEEFGVGELFINSIDRDGMMNGYDIELINKINKLVSIPIVACGGAGSMQHFKEVVDQTGISAVSAGSLFVYHGPHRAVLINYPSQDDIKRYLY